jgi:hypothetical protein
MIVRSIATSPGRLIEGHLGTRSCVAVHADLRLHGGKVLCLPKLMCEHSILAAAAAEATLEDLRPAEAYQPR